MSTPVDHLEGSIEGYYEGFREVLVEDRDAEKKLKSVVEELGSLKERMNQISNQGKTNLSPQERNQLLEELQAVENAADQAKQELQDSVNHIENLEEEIEKISKDIHDTLK